MTRAHALFLRYLLTVCHLGHGSVVTRRAECGKSTWCLFLKNWRLFLMERQGELMHRWEEQQTPCQFRASHSRARSEGFTWPERVVHQLQTQPVCQHIANRV